jgi:two-component system NtrC family response regulator
MACVLIVDDDDLLREALCGLAAHLGHDAVSAATRREAADKVVACHPDLVMLDVILPDGSGLDLLPELKALPDPPEVLIITGKSDEQGAEKAINSGAWDYVSKPAEQEEYLLHMRRALEYRQERKRGESPERLEAFRRGAISGDSPPLLEALKLASRAAAGSMGVLLTGETGTGKELFARAIHDSSLRRDKPFVVVDCAAIPENLVESMLFGHEKGAFTGADSRRDGLIRQAHGGTLFLDEVGELPLTLQKAFLRVLQEHRFRPVGAAREVESDFRLIAATNRQLEAELQAGRFREDLLYRLASFAIRLPPLRERLDDLPALVEDIVTTIQRRDNLPQIRVSPEFLEALARYDWPGNVRELFNVVELALAANPGVDVLRSAHLPTHIRVKAAQSRVPENPQDEIEAMARRTGEAQELPEWAEFKEQTLSRAERAYLERLLGLTGGDMERAQAVSGLSRSRLYTLLRKHGLRPGGE